MSKRADCSALPLPDGYYGLAWWALALIALPLAIGVLLLLSLALLPLLVMWSAPFPLNVVATVPFLLLGFFLIGILGAQVTPIRLAREYVQCYVFFVWPVRVHWNTITELRTLPLSARLVCASGLTPFHATIWLGLSMTRYPGFQLTFGLRCRKQLFWEIHRRASQAQGRNVPILGWAKRRVR